MAYTWALGILLLFQVGESVSVGIEGGGKSVCSMSASVQFNVSKI